MGPLSLIPSIANAYSCFVGRRQELNNISNYLQLVIGQQRTVIIAGEPGSGKSILAVQWASENFLQYSGGNALLVTETVDTLYDGLLKLANFMGLLNQNYSKGEIWHLVLKALASSPPMLIILDNLDVSSPLGRDVLEKLQPLTKHHFLITTRSLINCPRHFKHILLNVFTEEECAEYFQKSVDTECFSPEAVKQLRIKLGSLPLALSQATATMKTSKLSVNGYIELFDKYGVKKMMSKPLPEGGAGVYTTLSVALDRLQHYPRARAVLEYCSFLHAEHIPVKLFEKLFQGDVLELNEALENLQEKGVVAVHGIDSDRHLSIHRLTQDVSRVLMTETNDEVCKLRDTLQLVGSQLETDTADGKIQKNNQHLIVHIVELIAHARRANCKDIFFGGLLNVLGMIRGNQQSLKEAEELLTEALEFFYCAL